jgi:hypothetical protein
MTTEAWLQALTAGIVDVGGLGKIETSNFKSSVTAHSDMVHFTRSFFVLCEYTEQKMNVCTTLCVLGALIRWGRVVRLHSVPGTAFWVLTHCVLTTYLLTYLIPCSMEQSPS